MYFVYELWNPITDKPFYVGYGKNDRKTNGQRYDDHLKEARNPKPNSNLHKINTINQILNSGEEPVVKIVHETDCNTDAQLVEKQLISYYGRKTNGGILTNLTDGGDGGVTHTQTVEEREIKSFKMKEWYRTLEHTKKTELVKKRGESISNFWKGLSDVEKENRLKKSLFSDDAKTKHTKAMKEATYDWTQSEDYRKKQSDITKRKWEEKSQDEKIAFSEKMSDVQRNKTQKQKDAENKKRKEWFDNLSDKEKKAKIDRMQTNAVRKKRGKAISKAHQDKISKMTPEEYDKYIEMKREAGRKSAESRRAKKAKKNA